MGCRCGVAAALMTAVVLREGGESKDKDNC
jgi:hypothetical protein